MKKLYLLLSLLIILPVIAYQVYMPDEYYYKDDGWEYRGVFEKCTSLTKVTIGDANTDIDLTTIGSEAFQSCSALKEVYIGNTVGDIKEDIFDSCNALTFIYFTGTKAEWEAIEGIEDADIPSTATIHYNYKP